MSTSHKAFTDAEIKHNFDMYDLDKSGFITVDEFRNVYKKFGIAVDEGAISRIFNTNDVFFFNDTATTEIYTILTNRPYTGPK
mgnify:CR=1 FL=1